MVSQTPTVIQLTMKSKAEFLKAAARVKRFTSITGSASYSSVRLVGSTLHFIRDNTGQPWSFDVEPVYEVYAKEKVIDTSVLRKYISGRTYSPSLGLLIATGFCHTLGNRIE